LESIQEIIASCLENNNKYQKIFYERYFGYCLKIVFRYIYRYDKAIDIVNDGFVKIFRNLVKFHYENPENLEKILLGWMRTIMVNTAIDSLRKDSLLPEIGALDDNVWQHVDRSRGADQNLLYKELIQEVKKLPPSYRAVFNMYVIDGFTHQEIANSLGISVGASKSNLSKARALLQKKINASNKQLGICNL
jgi:RNA polymerase sigma factor (sigma-70 family)